MRLIIYLLHLFRNVSIYCCIAKVQFCIPLSFLGFAWLKFIAFSHSALPSVVEGSNLPKANIGTSPRASSNVTLAVEDDIRHQLFTFSLQEWLRTIRDLA